MRSNDEIQVKNNIFITARERGKLVARRSCHNIWLNLGKEFLAQLMAYSTFTPLTGERNDRVRYMGFGIGGNRQLALATANSAPITPSYAGSNLQTDTNTALTTIERPVRVTGSTTNYPGLITDAWLGQIQAPPVHATATEVTFTRLFTELEISYSTYLTVPLSEIGLFTHAADPSVYNNTMIAYDTFDTISKTAAVEFEVAWTVRF